MSTPEAAVTPAELTLEEKIAARFPPRPEKTVNSGLPQRGEAEPESPGDEGEAPSLAEVEWGGSKYQLPSELKDAFEKATDYTRKTQELAEQRRVLEHSRELITRGQAEAAFQQSVAEENRELAVIDAYLSQASKLNWTGMSTDQMIRQRMEVDQVRDRRDQLVKSVQEKQGKFQDEMTQTMSQLRARAREMAAKSIPSFNEETEKAIKQYAMAEGLSETETDNVLLDPRSAKILWKASQFDKVKAGTAKAVTQAAKAVRPGGSSERMPQDVRAKLDYQKAIGKASTAREKNQLIEDRLLASPLFGRRK